MSSLFFSSSSSLPSLSSTAIDDPHLELTVTPSASAFYAGEVFTATITFRNTRKSHTVEDVPIGSRVVSAVRPQPILEPRQHEPTRPLPPRQKQIGLHLSSAPPPPPPPAANAIAGPSKPRDLHRPLHLSPNLPDDSPYSPGANPSTRAGWPTFRSPDQASRGHSRRAKSLALGKGQLSPQQLVWALGERSRTPPPLPRRPNGQNHIPDAHPHSRKQSLASPISAPVNGEDQFDSLPNVLEESSVIDLTPLSPPPIHPRSRLQQPRTTTILWAYTRLKATFHPSNAYIPPDPLLPLRSLMLHQPVGSGSLLDAPSKPSRWQPSFGTGAIGSSTRPSLTGSLFGLAKDLVSGGAGGSLEEERKRVWNLKDLPVLETHRSLLGVDIQLKEGESKSFTYSLSLPKVLPPSHRGKAFRFAYDLVVSLSVGLPGKRQKTSEILVPVRVWAHVSVADNIPMYDILKPVMGAQEGVVATPSDKKGVSEDRSLEAYAKGLLDGPIVSPSEVSATRPLEQAHCGEAVEVLSRHSPKSTYDIAKDGQPVATLTLTKTVFRLGESVVGLVMFNGKNERRVLRFSAFLESHEIIPETLRPDCYSPDLSRLHADFHTAYAINTKQMAFSLDIPSDATPAFGLLTGSGGDPGGLEWRVRLSMCVSTKGVHLVPIAKATGAAAEGQVSTASSSIAPLVPVKRDTDVWREQETEIIECDIPIRVLAGNTAFLVRPSTQII
ncbi:Rgp1-domain-containing protein [Kockovaella imperatae]|uniref:Rgp1-domain-containing protein n=1 Tax=Kockovaella imperatae TaxID=4999 RepID=A0A1Y1UP98_9TREE|nr:Rgp1-domain-containing protein [Kockovaella imperatae]ORX39858.1 Rgp1-domain-containing protein [Kockovaella imperatae]